MYLGSIQWQAAWMHAHAWLMVAAPYLACTAIILAIVAVLFQLSLRRRFKRLSLGRTGSIEESVSILGRDVKELQGFRSELEKYLKLAELRLRGSVQGVGVVRFNPFQGDGSGGNQSYSVALLDERHSGVVLSAIYARDRVGVYAKPVDAGASSFELTTEEKSAIEKAQQIIAKNRERPTP